MVKKYLVFIFIQKENFSLIMMIKELNSMTKNIKHKKFQKFIKILYIHLID